LGYPLAIVRIKRSLIHALPLNVGVGSVTPLAGPFDHFTRARLSFAVGKFPFAQKVERGVRDTYEIEAPGGGRLEVWLTPDGHVFMDSQAGLELVLALYIDLLAVTPEIAIEDPQRGVLHGAESFKEFLCGEDTVEKPLRDIITEENVA
jgi:hypothetical protein